MSFIDNYFTKKLKPGIEKDVEQRLEKKFSNTLDNFVRSLDPFLNHTKSTLPGNWKVIDPGELGLGAKTGEYLKQYMEWVYANASAIAESVSGVEFELYKYIDGSDGEEVEQIHQHELLEHLYKVNNYTTKTDFIYAIQLYLTLTGEAPIRVKMNGGSISELWLLNPAYFKVFVGKDKDGFEMITGYEYADPKEYGKKISLKPWEVIFMKTWNPENQWRGIGIVEAAARTIDVLAYSEQYNLQFFKNSAIPYIALYTDQKLTDDTFERIKETFKSEYQGVENAYKTAILEQGLKIERLQTSAKDMDFLEQQRFMRDKLMAMFKTTKVALGITEDVNRANAEASEYVFLKHCIKPKMRRIVDQLNEFYVPLFDTSGKLFLDFEDPIPADSEAKSKEYALAVDKWMTKNEIRRELGLPEIDGGDEIWQPLMLAPMGISKIEEEPTPEEEKPTPEEGEEEPEIIEEEEEGKTIKYRILKVKQKPKERLLKKYKEQIARLKNRNVTIKQLTKELEKKIKKVAQIRTIQKRTPNPKRKYKNYRTLDTQERFHKNKIQLSEPYENKIKSEIKSKIYEKQKKDIFAKLSKKGVKFIIRKPRKTVVKSADDYMYNKSLYIKAGIDLLTPVMKELIEQHGEEALELLGSSVEYELLGEARKYLTKEPIKASKSFNDTTYTKVRKSLADGLEKGEGIPKLKARINKLYSGLEAYQLENIARTETSRAVGFATLDGYKQSGVVKGKEWLTALDERTCAFCESMNGKIVELEEDFFKEGDTMKVGKESLKFEYGDVPSQPLHNNCFLHHSVKIYTDQGIKTINNIKVGDFVLTHNGRYKKVIRLLNKTDRYKGKVIKIRYKGKTFGKTNTRNSVTITPEHPFLTQRGWILAKDLLLSDKLYVVAKRCITCKKQIPFWKDKFCSQKCNLNHMEKTRKQGLSNMGKNNGMYGKTKEKHPQWKGGKIWWRGKEWDNTKLKIRKRDDYICQNCDMTEKEHQLKYKQPLQVHHINPYRYSKNNDYDNLITLCCVCHKRIEGTDNRNILDNGGIEFMAIPVLEIDKIDNFQGEKLYNFAVEDDESYIAEGIVTHNCRCDLIPVLEMKQTKPKIKRTKKSNPQDKAGKILEQIEKEINGRGAQEKAQKVS